MTRVTLKRSTTPGEAPVSLLPGEPAVDTAAGAARLFVGDENGAPALIAALTDRIVYPTMVVARGSGPLPAGVTEFRTLGRGNPGDGGEAYYRRSASTDNAPGMVLIGGEWWELDPRQDIYAEQFGVAKDGVTDDSGAIRAALTYCANYDVGALNFRAGAFATDRVLSIPNTRGFQVRGAGGEDGGTRFVSLDPEAKWVCADVGRVTMEDFAVDCAGLAPQGVLMEGTSPGNVTTMGGCILRGIVVANATEDGIVWGWGADNWRTYNCRTENSADYDAETANQNSGMKVKVRGTDFGSTFSSVGWGVDVSDGGGDDGKAVFVGSHFNFCGKGYVRRGPSDSSVETASADNGAVVVESPYVENLGLSRGGTPGIQGAIGFLNEAPGRLIINTPQKVNFHRAAALFKATDGELEYRGGAPIEGRITVWPWPEAAFITTGAGRILTDRLVFADRDLNRDEDNPYFTGMRSAPGGEVSTPAPGGWSLAPLAGRLLARWDGTSLAGLVARNGTMAIDTTKSLTQGASIRFTGDGVAEGEGVGGTAVRTSINVAGLEGDQLVWRVCLQAEQGASVGNLNAGGYVKDFQATSVDYGRQGAAMEAITATTDDWLFVDHVCHVHDGTVPIDACAYANMVEAVASDATIWIDCMELWTFNADRPSPADALITGGMF